MTMTQFVSTQANCPAYIVLSEPCECHTHGRWRSHLWGWACRGGEGIVVKGVWQFKRMGMGGGREKITEGSGATGA